MWWNKMALSELHERRCVRFDARPSGFIMHGSEALLPLPVSNK